MTMTDEARLALAEALGELLAAQRAANGAMARVVRLVEEQDGDDILEVPRPDAARRFQMPEGAKHDLRLERNWRPACLNVKVIRGTRHACARDKGHWAEHQALFEHKRTGEVTLIEWDQEC